MKSKLAAVAGLGLASLALFAGSAAARPLAHGDFIHVTHHLNANQSNNWFGYNQGTLEQGTKLFSSITGDWTVPTATQHTAGQDESSSDWIGIGGGCIDANCTVTDNTLIQTGTEQDVDASGKASYSAWWELVPVTAITISNFNVSPGDHMHASLTQLADGSDVWTITLQDVTKGESFSTTVPYPSTHLTAEWIEETPLVIGTNAGLADLPTLSRTTFDHATVNGASAQLKSAERILLTTSGGKVIGTPSAPDPQRDGFALCAWATTCQAPG